MSFCVVVWVCTYSNRPGRRLARRLDLIDPKLVVTDFCTANRHRSLAKGTNMSCMLVEKGSELAPKWDE